MSFCRLKGDTSGCHSLLKRCITTNSKCVHKTCVSCEVILTYILVSIPGLISINVFPLYLRITQADNFFATRLILWDSLFLNNILPVMYRAWKYGLYVLWWNLFLCAKQQHRSFTKPRTSHIFGLCILKVSLFIWPVWDRCINPGQKYGERTGWTGQTGQIYSVEREWRVKETSKL